LVEFEARPVCELEFVRAVHDRSVLAVPDLGRSDPAQPGPVMRSPERLEAKLNLEGTARGAAPDVTLKVQRMRPELQTVHQRRKPWPKEFRWPNRDQ
jgi:hypothetical protein